MGLPHMLRPLNKEPDPPAGKQELLLLFPYLDKIPGHLFWKEAFCQFKFFPFRIIQGPFSILNGFFISAKVVTFVTSASVALHFYLYHIQRQTLSFPDWPCGYSSRYFHRHRKYTVFPDTLQHKRKSSYKIWPKLLQAVTVLLQKKPVKKLPLQWLTLLSFFHFLFLHFTEYTIHQSIIPSIKCSILSFIRCSWVLSLFSFVRSLFQQSFR